MPPPSNASTPEPQPLRAVCLALALLAALGPALAGPARAEGPFPGNPLIEIPGGPFVFGSNEGEGNEAPQRVVRLAPFHINKYEITNRLYAAFVEATGHRPAFYHDHPLFESPNHPVVGLSWDDANDFCRYHGLKLPSEQQWERAARGPEGHLYPWGNEPPTIERTNRGARECCDVDERDGYLGTAPVGSYPDGQTPEGVMDMAGNVWELVDGWYGAYDGGGAVAQEKRFRVLRGGAYNSHDWKLRATYRLAYDGDFRFSASGGFRCARDSASRPSDPTAQIELVATGPRATAGYQVTLIAHDLVRPSGAVRDGDSLILTDLATGNVVRRAADGTMTIIYAGLPTGLDIMGEPTGPYKVQVRNGRIFIAQGWQDVDREEGPLDHALLEIAPGGGEPRVVSRDFWNPFDFEWGGDAWYVADGARNTLVRVTPQGRLSTVFAFARLEPAVPEGESLSPTEFKEEASYEVDAVPTGIAIRKGRVFAALFGGFPFVAGGGAVVSVAVNAGHAGERIEARDLNAPTDIAFDREGRLLVLEMGVFDMGKGFQPGTGRLLRIDLGAAERTILLDGLTRPVTVVPMDGGAALVVQLSGDILEIAPAP